MVLNVIISVNKFLDQVKIDCGTKLGQLPKKNFPKPPELGSSSKLPWILEHCSFPGGSRKQESIALTCAKNEIFADSC